jgi:hypothetical protein
LSKPSGREIRHGPSSFFYAGLFGTSMAVSVLAITTAAVATTGSGNPSLPSDKQECWMTDLAKRIEEIELKASESERIGNLSTDPEVRVYNERLAVELREYAQKLRGRLRSPREQSFIDPIIDF